MSEIESETIEFAEETDELGAVGQISAIVQGTDWTTETIVTQMERGNIALNPKFQRRDAWSRAAKSRLIESLVLGLPVPQIVLAESKDDRGKFIVLDGKQRLLSLLQFWGKAPGPNNAFSLSSLQLRPHLTRKTFKQLSEDSALEEDHNALCNQTIRTVVIRNWKSDDLLHEVFLRLNTGSVKLSPQELRQALHPGPFTSYVDDASADLQSLQALLNLKHADPRMRDVEILARFLSFRFFGREYPGRMKKFLDASFAQFNSEWADRQAQLEEAVEHFDEGLQSLLALFNGKPARKPDSTQFNRAIFDALIHYQSQEAIRKAIGGKKTAVSKAYASLFTEGSAFARAIESDTAGAPNTYTRFDEWGKALSKVTKTKITILKPREKKLV